jgi:hypothetical protein
MTHRFRRSQLAGAVPRAALGTLLLVCVPAFAAAGDGNGGGPSLNLTIHDTGLAFGHAPRVNGVRVNFQDRYLERVNGLNLTLWSPSGPGGKHTSPARNQVGGEVNGLALGLVGPVASRMHGVQLGLAAVVSNERLAGVSVGGLAVVSEGEHYGIALAGLAVVSEGTSTSIGAAGLAFVSEGDLNGVHVAGLATVAEGNLRGIHLSGLASVAEGRMSGIGVAGLATVAEREIHGLGIAGLATASERFAGIGIAGLAVATGEEMRGIALAGGVTGAGDLVGLAIAPYNRYEGVQRGLTIGLFNWATELRGVQIGLLNRADNNPAPFRWLPLVNAHL